jgi:diaminopimelate epimerase
MRFWKGQALGNDYLVLDVTGSAPPGPGVVRGLCDRHRGVGADGVLAGDLGGDPVRLRIFNPDGSEAEKSGNGLRIFGTWLHHLGRVDGPFRVALPGEEVVLAVEGRAPDGTLTLRVDMGRARFRAEDIPFTGADPDADVMGETLALDDETVAIHLVSMGNPHCVIFPHTFDDDELRRIGPLVQARPEFPEGVNVQLARVADSATLDARIWERGAGETLASGSSACAVAAAARRSGRTDAHRVRVRMPGGTVQVEIDDEWRVRLTGEAQGVFEGEVRPEVVEGWE